MLRKFFLFILSIIISVNFQINALGSNIKYDEIINDLEELRNDKTDISRAECITIIMKIIGVDDMTADNLANGSYDAPVFSDVYGFEKNAGYIYAAKFSGIAFGVDSLNQFDPNRTATIKEALAFMSRCLKKSDSLLWDNVLVDSAGLGLLNYGDSFANNIDIELNKNNFYILIYRLLNHDRYVYWYGDIDNNAHMFYTKIDETNSIKYIDWLRQSDVHFLVSF